MTNEEAKFMLRGYRPNGSDAGDPAIAEALEQAARDPALKAWLEREQRFDSAIAEGLAKAQPPVGLRESILAGTRLGSRRPGSVALPWWIGIAAALVISIATITYLEFPGTRNGGKASIASIVDVAWSDLNGGHPNTKHADAFPDVAAWLQNNSTRMHNGLPLSFDHMINEGCRTQKIVGSLFVEVCFKRNGTMFHVYMAPRRDFRDQGLDREPMFQQKGNLATASWADDKFVYVLASADGADAIRAIL